MTRERKYQIPAMSVMDAEAKAVLRVVKDNGSLELDGDPITSMTTERAAAKGEYTVTVVWGRVEQPQEGA